jgi:maleylpyruvate isomerase
MEPYAASPPAERRVEIAGCRAAHDRLLAGIEGLSRAEAAAPSALPGWTVGHVLSHLARNAEAVTNMVQGVKVGEVRPMYAGPEARALDIEAGAAKPAARVVEDVRASAEALHAAWESLTDDQWAFDVQTRTMLVPAGYLPVMRWREVEIHHADLARGFGWADWSSGWLRADLPRLAALLAEQDEPAGRRLAAVLAGRLDAPVTLPTVLG